MLESQDGKPDKSRISTTGAIYWWRDRKTGITLQDTGVRDEHGLEPIDGIFSSPQKSPEKRNGVGHNTTADEEEDMDIGDSELATERL